MKVSLVIPVLRGGAAWQICLAHVAALNPQPHEVIVVADGDPADAAAVTFPVTLLVAPAPRGPAWARNWGAQVATGDVLFFVDADVALPVEAVAQVTAAFAAESTVAALIGSYDDAPAAPNFCSQYKNLLHHYVHQTGAPDAFTFWGACGAVRRTLFWAVGGFDVGYARPSIEDIELGYRLRAAGYTIRLVKTLQVKHLKQWTPVSLIRTDIWQRAVPWAQLILHTRAMPNDLNLGHSQRFSVGLSLLLPPLLLLALFIPAAGWLLLLKVVALLGLNWGIYRFFWQRRGGGFALAALPWHWLYFMYSGLAFAGVFLHVWWEKRVGKPVDVSV
jgi:cellulose synthase/poly-beta-1,6-N-acetylglucosamine synthase-like glycosyltransferase